MIPCCCCFLFTPQAQVYREVKRETLIFVCARYFSSINKFIKTDKKGVYPGDPRGCRKSFTRDNQPGKNIRLPDSHHWHSIYRRVDFHFLQQVPRPDFVTFQRKKI